MAIDFGSKTKTDGIIDINSGAFKYRYEPATKTIFVGTNAGGKVKTFYKWDGRDTDEVIILLKSKGLIE